MLSMEQSINHLVESMNNMSIKDAATKLIVVEQHWIGVTTCPPGSECGVATPEEFINEVEWDYYADVVHDIRTYIMENYEWAERIIDITINLDFERHLKS